MDFEHHTHLLSWLCLLILICIHFNPFVLPRLKTHLKLRNLDTVKQWNNRNSPADDFSSIVWLLKTLKGTKRNFCCKEKRYATTCSFLTANHSINQMNCLPFLKLFSLLQKNHRYLDSTAACLFLMKLEF